MIISRKRDSQRSKVYKWESTCVPYGNILDEIDCIKLINNICYDYFVEVPKLDLYSRRRNPYYYSKNHKICIPDYARYSGIIIHEVAHLVHDAYGDRSDAWHGPGFVGLYCELLCKYMKVDDLKPLHFPCTYLSDELNSYKNSDFHEYLFNSARRNNIKVQKVWWSEDAIKDYIGIA